MRILYNFNIRIQTFTVGIKNREKVEVFMVFFYSVMTNQLCCSALFLFPPCRRERLGERKAGSKVSD